MILRTRRPVVHLQTAGRTGAIAELDGGGALRTSDAGQAWRRIRQPLATSYATSAAGLRVRSRMNGNRDVLEVGRTNDGGSSWRYRGSPCPNPVSASGIVDLVTAQLGWLVCLGQPGMGNEAKAVYRTLDGGKTWISLARQSLLPARGDRGDIISYGYPIGIAFAQDGFGLICESRGTLLVTHNAGVTWAAKPRVVEPEAGETYGASVFPNGRAFVLFRHLSDGAVVQRRLIATADYGRSWHVVHEWTEY